MQAVTNRAPDAERSWAIDDAVVSLRVHGTAHAHELPAPPIDRWAVGAAADCDLVLHDMTGCVSRHHAELIREDGAWTLRDRGSTNGIYRDQERLPWFQLRPADEIEVGGVMLIPESHRSTELRALLARLIGWRPERLGDVDRALRCVRDMARLRTALVLAGTGNLTGIARCLHELVLGEARPFVVARSGLLESLAQAETGTLCIVAGPSLPADFVAASEQLRAATSRVRVVICCPEGARTAAPTTKVLALIGRATALLRVGLIELPSLASRADERDRVIWEFALDAAARLGATGPAFRDHEWQWLHRLELATLEDIEALVMRLVALRNWGVAGGARRLKISHTALSQWAQRHRIPT
jgi:hypothetical protein